MTTSLREVDGPASMGERLLKLYARRFPLQRGKMRVIDALWHRAVGSGARREAELWYGGFRMVCDLDEKLQRQLYFFGTYFVDRRLLECFAAATRDADVVFDVGANVGIFSLAAVASGARAVHAFEPTREIAARLRDTIERNRIRAIRLHEAAVSDVAGTVNLVRYRGPDGSNGGMNYVSETRTESSESVPSVTLDDVCDREGVERVDVLKIDIQGNEHLALRGAARLLAAGRIGTIITELNWTAPGAPDCPATQTIRILAESGYRFAAPGKTLRWEHPGDWLRRLPDVVARR